MTEKKGSLLLERENSCTKERETAPGKVERNYGIDLLRMLAMLFIVVLHVLGHGGILTNLNPASMGYKMSCLLQTIAYCSVNCYALISGYVSYGGKFKYHRIITLWFQVVFYTVFLVLLFQNLHPEVIGQLDWIAALLPVSFNQYWYFTAYFCMFFFIPFFNRLLDTLTQRQATTLVLTIILLLSVFPTICCVDLFQTDYGYSVIWLSALYLLGAYAKKYHMARQIPSSRSVVLFLICILFAWGYKLLMEAGKLIPVGFMQDGNDLMHYTSLPILLASIALLFFFCNLKLHRFPFLVRTIQVLSPSAFSVYLLHTQSLPWFFFLADRFVWCTSLRVWKLIPVILGIAIGIYLVCSVIDFVRRMLFRILHIRALSIKLEMGLSKLCSSLVGITAGTAVEETMEGENKTSR